MSKVSLKNQHVEDVDTDALYHLGLTYRRSEREEWKRKFGDVKFVCLGGTAERMTRFAHRIAEELGIAPPFGYALTAIGKQQRYTLYKVGPVLVANHGMGMPSISILLHEVAKLLAHAEAEDPIFIRIGTSGGVGVEPGTVCITSECLNGLLDNEFTLPILGKLVKRKTTANVQLVEDLRKLSEDIKIAAVVGKTLSCDDFYEGQGRLDGAICEYTMEDKMNFLHQAHSLGVSNIEMEALQFSGFCHMLNLKFLVVCVALLNRLDGDQVRLSLDELAEFEDRPVALVIEYIRRALATA